MQRSITRRKSFPFHIVVFLAPAVIAYTIFMVYPLLNSLRLSFYTQSTTGGVETFAGFKNYVTLLTDSTYQPRFWGALLNNIVFFVIHMVVQNSIGLMLAALLSSGGRARTIYRTLIFMPTVLSVVIIGFVWNLILSPLWGVAKDSLKLIGMVSLFKPWLGLPESALITISLISVWQFVGIPMILFYVVLIGIPEELFEAARVDGASGWDIFWRIKFPLILPQVGIVGILTFVGNFNAFDLIYAVKGALAGPDFHTDIMGTFFYRTFYGHQLTPPQPDLGATIAAMMLLIILTGVLFYMFVWQRRVQTYEL